MWEKGDLVHCYGNVKWHVYYEKHYGAFLKKLKVELTHDPTDAHLGMYPKEQI